MQPGNSLLFLLVAGLLGLVVGGGLAYAALLVFVLPNREKKLQQAARRDVEKAKVAERERLQVIYGLISNMTATLKYDRVLELALDLAGNALRTPEPTAKTTVSGRLVSAALLFNPASGGKTSLRVGTSRGFPHADQRVSVPGNDGTLGKAISSGEPQICTDVAQDTELSRFGTLRYCKAVYCMPLRVGLDAFGVLIFGHPDPEFFTPTNRELLGIMNQQAMIALQNARLYSDLEKEKERMVEIQEEARKKLARDLHDGPTQSVAAIAMRVNYTRRLLERDMKGAVEELVKIEELARRTTKEIRHMLFTLRPLVLESQGLTAALEAMAEKMHDTYEQNVLVSVDERVLPDLEMGKQTVIFYIAEEAVNNARKHAQAQHIWIRLKIIQPGMALLEIQDDGVGFNVGAVDASYDSRGSLGMVNMRERSELVSGVLKIDSAEGKGTRIQVLIPMTDDAAERLRRGR